MDIVSQVRYKINELFSLVLQSETQYSASQIMSKPRDDLKSLSSSQDFTQALQDYYERAQKVHKISPRGGLKEINQYEPYYFRVTRGIESFLDIDLGGEFDKIFTKLYCLRGDMTNLFACSEEMDEVLGKTSI
ncbi:hypothetical protein J4408_00915 [Candidatus Pacearchaeota archaeon]|nr:hypothetical protein [Candidatus Pacearchaeota archaeon]